MKWISVEDRLPELLGFYSDQILMFGINKNMGIGVREPWIGVYTGVGQWFSNGKRIDDVTHWAEVELPETSES